MSKTTTFLNRASRNSNSKIIENKKEVTNKEMGIIRKI